MRASLLRIVLNIWPPFWAAGIRVRRIAPDFREAEVEMRLRWYNRNYVRTHFGGSLYAMTDPFYMLMLLHNLGRDYVIWDQSGHIEYVRPGRGLVRARFALGSEQIDDIRRKADAGEKVLPQFTVAITNAGGETVARIEKTLYVRKKR
jgi:acyl-coenzyme A thioesterase PaaI-like protein